MTDINYLGTIPLGKIQFFEQKKASSLMAIPLPTQDADQVAAVDTLGVVNYINIKGRMTGDFLTIQGYCYDIRAILDGNQAASNLFKSPFVNSKSNSLRRVGYIGVNTATSASNLIDTKSGVDFTDWHIDTNDKVKNLVTGNVATVTGVVSDNQLSLSSDIFPVAGGTGVAYALTGTIRVKILDFNYNWELPGLSWLDYELSLIQVA